MLLIKHAVNRMLEQKERDSRESKRDTQETAFRMELEKFRATIADLAEENAALRAQLEKERKAEIWVTEAWIPKKREDELLRVVDAPAVRWLAEQFAKGRKVVALVPPEDGTVGLLYAFYCEVYNGPTFELNVETGH
jgi:hypothetical protein